MEIGKAIKLIMLERGIDSYTMTVRIGKSPAYVSLLLNDKKRMNMEVLGDMAKAIGVKVSDIVIRAEGLK